MRLRPQAHNERQKEIIMITLVQKNKSKGILTWYARVPDQVKKGSVHFFSLGTASKSEAKIILQHRIRAGTFDARVSPSQMTLGEAAVRFEKHLRAKGLKSNSITMYLTAINLLSSLFEKPVAEITNKDLSETFLARNEGNKASTYNSTQTMVSIFFKYIVDVLELIPINPINKAIPRRKKIKAARFFWTQEQIDRIIAHAPNPKTRLLWCFMAFAGLRKSEAVAMRPSKISDGKIHLIGKGDKAAEIPVCPRLQREIERYTGEWNFYYSEETLKNVATRAIPEGFQGKAHAHRFRHSFGSNLIRAGVNIKVVQKLMRHENISMTLDIYGHILDTDAEDAINKVFS